MKIEVRGFTKSLEGIKKDREQILKDLFENKFGNLEFIIKHSLDPEETIKALEEELLKGLDELNDNYNLYDEATNMELFSGQIGATCYATDNFDEIISRGSENALKRANGCIKSGHHSIFDHSNIVLSLEGIPKLLAMILNNEHQYATSEKSARYTEMHPSKRENVIYQKWIEIFKKVIKEKHPDYTDSEIEKKALENARYQISVKTPSNMIYSTSIRQINYIYAWCIRALNDIQNNSAHPLLVFIKKELREFTKELSKLPFINSRIEDIRNRDFSLFVNDNNYPEVITSDSYAVNYKASFASLAQHHRNRSVYDTISIPDKPEFYVPPILNSYPELIKEWLTDINSLQDLYPQGMLVSVRENGLIKNFIQKIQERLCNYAQLETCDTSKEILMKIYQSLLDNNDPMALEIEKYTHGARCTFPDYECNNSCQRKSSITLTRDI